MRIDLEEVVVILATVIAAVIGFFVFAAVGIWSLRWPITLIIIALILAHKF